MPDAGTSLSGEWPPLPAGPLAPTTRLWPTTTGSRLGLPSARLRSTWSRGVGARPPRGLWPSRPARGPGGSTATAGRGWGALGSSTRVDTHWRSLPDAPLRGRQL